MGYVSPTDIYTIPPEKIAASVTPEWPREDVDELLRLWRGGNSALGIAVALDRSRNAVIGKLHRMGLAGGRQAVEQRSSFAKRPKAFVPVHVPRPRPAPLVEPESKRLSIFDLEARHCRWPEGAGAALVYCGNETLPGQSYCAWHRGKAFVTGTQRDFDNIAGACMGARAR